MSTLEYRTAPLAPPWGRVWSGENDGSWRAGKVERHDSTTWVRVGARAHRLLGCCTQNEAVAAGDDWAQHNGDSNETNFSPLAQINSRNVRGLGLAWYLDLPAKRPSKQRRLKWAALLFPRYLRQGLCG